MSLIRKPAQLTVQQFIKTLLYGQPGIGKTTFALSSPQPLLLDFDRGVHRVNPKHQVDTLQVGSWEEVLQVLLEDLTAYKTLVTDTAGKMLDYMGSYLIKNDPKLARKDGALTLQGYGARKVMFNNFLHQIEMLGKNIVFVAHDKEEKDGDTKFIRPEIGGSSGNDLIREIDLVGYMEASGKKRTISFDPCERFYGKNTCNLENIIELPDVVTGGKDNILLSEIFVRYEKAIQRKKQVGEDYSALMKVIKDGIDATTDVETLNGLIPWAQSLNIIWDSKLQASQMINAHAKVLGAKYNRSTNLYEVLPVENKEPANEAKTDEKQDFTVTDAKVVNIDGQPTAEFKLEPVPAKATKKKHDEAKV